ncbi:MAG TPA: PD-(D/E)XK nuclease family protein, partial [Gammaproteobacteria bacterium]|nr:PD-(D/E)XK nuclease family protein [Gammaproteobacteria bacterium]
MRQHLIESLKKGAIVLTATGRSANTLINLYNLSQKKHQSFVWPSPKIYTLKDWFNLLWREYSLDREFKGGILLTPWQQEALWEEIIKNSPWAQGLVQLSGTAKSAMKAWALLQRYQIPLDHHELQDEIEHVKEIEAFVSWATAYQRRLRENNWVDEIGMLEILPVPKVTTPFIGVVGFDDMPPQLTQYFEKCQKNGICIEKIIPYEKRTTKVIRTQFETPIQEFQAMANWAKALIENHAEGPIAIVLPELAKYRAELISVLDHTFFQESLLHAENEVSVEYNISAGEPLKKVPVILVAFKILGLMTERIALSDVTFLMRSPYIFDNYHNMGSGAELCNALFEWGQGQVDLTDLIHRLQREKAGEGQNQYTRTSLLLGKAANERIPPRAYWMHNGGERMQPTQPKNKMERVYAAQAWDRALKQLIPMREEKNGKRSYFEWASFFRNVLEKMNWPGERALTSVEHQAVKRFYAMLDVFSQLDVTCKPVNDGQALSQLSKMTSYEMFQPETRQVRMDVLGILEATALPFEHVWIGGMQNRAWPLPPNPNPFIPLSLQRKLDMPHATSEREYHFSKSVLEGLIENSQHVVLSSPHWADEQILAPSELIRSYVYEKPESFIRTTLLNQIPKDLNIWETIIEQNAPPVQGEEKIGGGSTLIGLQAACPFRAFAQMRLQAKRGEQKIVFGLRPEQRGKILHKILQILWQDLRDQKTLKAYFGKMLSDKIEEVTKQVISECQKLEPHIPKIVWNIEFQRIIPVLESYFVLEMSREPFTVVGCEQTVDVKLGDLSLTLRLDRVDKTETGERIVIDYKTGKVSLSDMLGPRPHSPQLPLYCLIDEKTSGVTFVELKSDGCQFIGISKTKDLCKGMISVDAIRAPDIPKDWGSLVDYWKKVLMDLSTAFMSGDASINPKDQETCLYCDFQDLCRI